MTDRPPLALGCMRLSTEPDRDETRAIEVLHAALDAGVTLLDTADAYCWTDDESRLSTARTAPARRAAGAASRSLGSGFF